VRDSAGIQIVENRLPQYRNGEFWTIAAHPSVAIGEAEGDGIAPADPLALALGAAALLLACAAAFLAPARELWRTDIAHTLRQL